MTTRDVFFEKSEVFFVFSGGNPRDWELRFYNPYGDSVTIAITSWSNFISRSSLELIHTLSPEKL